MEQVTAIRQTALIALGIMLVAVRLLQPYSAQVRASICHSLRRARVAPRCWGHRRGAWHADDFWHRAQHQRFSERVYAMWEREGRPEGRADEHWFRTRAFEES